ncbi:UvrD-helicase domain-containing protein [Shigella flexneri]
MRLNPGQQQAVQFDAAPAWCGGAVSGKLVLLPIKLPNPIRGCGYQARHIAAVTFTNKAAREMKERVGQTLGSQRGAWADDLTFHTLGWISSSVSMRRWGMKVNFSLFDDTDQLALLKELTEGPFEDDKVLLQQF